MNEVVALRDGHKVTMPYIDVQAFPDNYPFSVTFHLTVHHMKHNLSLHLQHYQPVQVFVENVIIIQFCKIIIIACS